jgi:hypothetical protein
VNVIELAPSAAPGAWAGERAPLEAVRGRLRLLVRRRLVWLRHLGDQAGGTAASGLPPDLLGELDDREAEAAFYAGRPELQPLARELESYERELADDRESRLAWLCGALGLTEEEREVIEACVAVAVDPPLARACALLQGEGTDPGVNEALIARLYGRALPLLGQTGALSRWHLVEVERTAAGSPAPLRLDPLVLAFACDKAAWDPAIARVAYEIEPVTALPDWPVAAEVEHVRRAWGRGCGVRLEITGPRGSGRRSFAGALGQALGHPAIALDTSAVPEAELPDVYLRAHRQGLLFGQTLVWFGEGVERRPPRVPASVPLEIVVGEPDLAAHPSPDPNVATERVALPPLRVTDRRRLWLRLLPESQAWSDPDLEQLAERYRLQVGDIVSVCRSGATTVGETRERCRAITRGRLGELGQQLDAPFTRADLLLPPALNQALDDLLFEAQERVRFWEQPAPSRLFPRGRGLVALMTGSPGTGKTMAAQVIAAELGLDLFRIDLASSVSKYIGETAKNLRKVFVRAAEMNAVLLFDEADALFSKRTEVRDAHDRYANTDTNYLLQLLEEFDGIALLATNKKHNMDAAFVRRIRYLMEFPRPGTEERRRIWLRLARELLGLEATAALEPALVAIAEALELSGAQIKLSLLAAMFIARQAGEPLGLPHLYRGIDRELVKEGRSIGPKERERVQRGGR